MSCVGDQLRTVSHGPVEIVVHDADRPESTTFCEFSLSHGDPALGLFGRIAPPPQALGLNFRRRGLEQDEECFRRPFENLRGPLNIDLEDDVSIVVRIWPGGSVQVAEKFGVFEKSVLCDVLLELLPGHVRVGIVGLTGALRPGGPTP